ncbi:MAG: SDR family oxidoreductase [Candidatus Woesearchaeota archaeon]
MNLNLKGKKVVVTGAGSGIGAIISSELVQENAYVIGIDSLEFDKSELSNLLVPHQKIDYFQGDVSDFDRMKEIFDSDRFDTIYGLVNNAAILGKDDSHGGRSIESFDRVISVNTRAPFNLIELLYPKMSEGGSIVNISSINADMQNPNTVLYAISKGGLGAMTRAYANTFGEKRIRVNTVSPGNVETRKVLEACSSSKEKKDLIDRFNERAPLHRGVRPEEVADSVLFLLSDRSSAITGQNILVDCGYSIAL